MITQYSPNKWSLNLFHVGKESIFALANKLSREKPGLGHKSNIESRNDPFGQARRSIQIQAQGTVFETELNYDFDKFAQKWKDVVNLTCVKKERKSSNNEKGIGWKTWENCESIKKHRGSKNKIVIQLEDQRTKLSPPMYFLGDDLFSH